MHLISYMLLHFTICIEIKLTKIKINYLEIYKTNKNDKCTN